MATPGSRTTKALAALGAVAAIITLVVFVSGKNLPDFVAQGPDEAPPAIPTTSQQPSVHPTPADDGTTTETPANTGEEVDPVAPPPAPTVSSITLPESFYRYVSYGHESRQSHTLSVNDAGDGAYAYGYWQDEKSIWADATAVGPQGIAAVTQVQQDTARRGQHTLEQGAVTCVWLQDADPNTPRHSVWCFRIDEALGLGMIVATHTATVGEIYPANVLTEIWNLTSVH